MLRRREDEIPRLNLTVRAAVGRQEIEKIGKVAAPPGQRAAAHYDRRIGQHAPDRGTEARQQRRRRVGRWRQRAPRLPLQERAVRWAKAATANAPRVTPLPHI